MEDERSLILRGKGDLWVGSLESLRDLEGIDAVVTIMHPDREEREYIQKCVGTRPHLFIKMHDTREAPIEESFDESTVFIESHIKRGHSVLVHCYAGVSRSVTLCVCYLVRCRGYKSPLDALTKIQITRPIANPNPGFMNKLWDFA